MKNDVFLLALRKPQNDPDKLIRSKKLLKIKSNLKGSGSRDEKKYSREKEAEEKNEMKAHKVQWLSGKQREEHEEGR